MTKTEFDDAMNDLIDAYPTSVKDSRLDVYYKRLKGFPRKALEIAVDNILDRPGISSFPNPGIVKEAVMEAQRRLDTDNRPPDMLEAIPAHSSFVDRMCAKKFAETLRKSRGDKLVEGWPEAEMTTYIQKVKTVANRIKDGDLTEEQAVRTLEAIS